MKKIICIALACLLLTGCSLTDAAKDGKTYDGDMEKALVALKWEDYNTAYQEADAFMTRVPHSTSAQTVREAAAWQKVFLAFEESKLLSDSQSPVTLDGKSLCIDPPAKDETKKFYLTDLRITTYYDTDELSQDFNIGIYRLSTITLEWKYSDSSWSTYEYRFNPDYVCKEDLSGISNWGDSLASDTEEEFITYLEEVLVPYMDELFELLEEECGVSPEALGFLKWNETDKNTN